MLQGTLFILAGASLYAAAQRLHADIKLRRGPSNVLYTILFILLAASSATSAVTMSPSAPNAATTLSLLCGTLLWGLLPWTSACLLRIPAGLTTDILSAAWITALISHLADPQQNFGTYWNGVSWLMLVTLAHSGIIMAWHGWTAGKPVVRRYLCGLLLLGIACLVSHVLGAPLFPFGFLLLLLLTENISAAPAPPGLAPALTHIPVRTIELTLDRQAGAQQPVTPGPSAREKTSHRAPASPPPIDVPQTAVCVDEASIQAPPTLTEKGRQTLMAIADELMDITVYATIALDRVHQDNPDPKFTKALLRRIRSRAIHSHRDANFLSRPDDEVNT